MKRGVAERGRPPPRLVLYSRSYCHLCDEMRAALEALRQELTFDLEVVDVDSDPALERRYDALVPVLVHRGRELARWRLDPAAFRARLSDIG